MVRDVERSLPAVKREDELENDVGCFLIYRPVSNWVTPLFLILGCKPSMVTALSLLLAVCLPIAAARLGWWAYLVVAALALAIHVLDCVDGNIARVRGQTSAPGALFDGFTDHIFWVLYFAAIGLLVERQGTGFWAVHGLHLALALIVLIMLHRELRNAYAAVYQREVIPTPEHDSTPLAWRRVRRAVISLESFYAFAVILGGALGQLPAVLAGIAVYVVFIFAAAVATVFQSARQRPDPASWHGR